jgi:hypothetical protein
MVQAELKSPEELIVKHLEDNGQKMSWLADRIEVTVGHLHSVLKGDEKVKRTLTEENRRKINSVLGTSF